MTLAQFAMTFWHDLAAPILAGNYYRSDCRLVA
ncbi:toxic polypeptide, small [Escherichia coli]|nr:toxic polypeptide, small [Escherichia coli]